MNLLKNGKRLNALAIDSFVDHPGLTEQLLRVQGMSMLTWNPPSIQEALAFPAVFRAVSMIATLVGSLSMQAWRNGILMSVPPTLVSRPGVFGTPRDFFRDTAWDLASAGEFIWKVVDRDENFMARRFLKLPLHEVRVEWNKDFPLVRDYIWRDEKLDPLDIEHGTLIQLPGSPRGIGPLQICGAALSSAVEADRWAARFFRRGGAPSVQINSPAKLNEVEASKAVDQWLLRESNEVRVVSGGMKAEAFMIDPEGAQLLQSRLASSAFVATMFGMDAELLNAAQSGSSITYANVGQRFDNFVRSTLQPSYLEPIEHGMSEKLTRTTVARFDLTTFLKADVSTQAQVYATLTGAGLSSADAAKIAGIDPLVDTQPVPAPEPVPQSLKNLVSA